MNAQNAPQTAQCQLNLADIGAVLVEIQPQNQRFNLIEIEHNAKTVAHGKREWIKDKSRKIEQCGGLLDKAIGSPNSSKGDCPMRAICKAREVAATKSQ